MKVQRISCYTIENDPSKKPLDFIEYSKFKYGHKPTAVKFADAMNSLFLKHYSLNYFIENHDKVIISTSPYWYTPPSAHALAIYFHHQINEMLIETGLGPVSLIKIHRSAAPSLDFSKLSHSEREVNMKRNALSFDPFFLQGKKLVLIEDARITGTHEKKIIEFMEKAGLEELTFVYVIDVSFGATDPDIENRMNHKWVNNLGTLQLLMKFPGDFILNSRACRLVLSWNNKTELEDFCKRLSDEMIFNLYLYSVNDGYGVMELYREGFDIVRKEISARYDQLKKIIEANPSAQEDFLNK